MVTDGRVFGGLWTQTKLQILEKFSNAYTTALKNQSFNLIFIDAFAGKGTISLKHTEDIRQLDLFEDYPGYAEEITDDPGNGASETRKSAQLDGSAIIAAGVTNRPFDELILIEKDPDQYHELRKEMEPFQESHRVTVENLDANVFLQSIRPIK